LPTFQKKYHKGFFKEGGEAADFMISKHRTRHLVEQAFGAIEGGKQLTLALKLQKLNP
jgi:hypothetical protein